jgi:hypothetical protein
MCICSPSELGSNDYINNFLQPFMADGTTYTHDQFIRLLVATLDRQLKARTNTLALCQLN